MAVGRMLECCCRSLWDCYLPAIGSAVDASAWVLTALAVLYLWLYEGAGAFPVWLHAADKMLDKLADVVRLDMRNDLESGIFFAAAGAAQSDREKTAQMISGAMTQQHPSNHHQLSLQTPEPAMPQPQPASKSQKQPYQGLHPATSYTEFAPSRRHQGAKEESNTSVSTAAPRIAKISQRDASFAFQA
ncbi:hypothetical protein Nepgr_026647 [Nepenthes gracilis]|uniref:Uncharacterized protein n=1 Tax=Nepenthes gracilis TaxID=150966 RepID=A0AAD3T8R5_NEPGR|nr:hypothetical protein Nepgr_026647 [Nepenthes gracilis]